MITKDVKLLQEAYGSVYKPDKDTKQLRKFVKEFTRLLDRYPDLMVYGDRDGDPQVCIRGSNLGITLPSFPAKRPEAIDPANLA